MKFYKRIISFVLVAVISFSSCLTFAFAAWYNDVAYYYTTSRFGPWCVSASFQLLGGVGDVVSASPFGTIIASCVNDGFNSFAVYYKINSLL